MELSSINWILQKNDLYQMVIYLAPGNYHGFHAPASWRANMEIHYPGTHLFVMSKMTQSCVHFLHNVAPHFSNKLTA